MTVLEEWKDIKHYEGIYKISNLGNVFSCRRKIILKPEKNNSGYCLVHLKFEGSRKAFLVHRLVAENFIENTKNKKCVNHIDENKENNTVENLEWVTHKENIEHSNFSSKMKGKKNVNSKKLEWYSCNPCRRHSFKRTCLRRGWNFYEFYEIESEYKSCRTKTYFYIKKQKEVE